MMWMTVSLETIQKKLSRRVRTVDSAFTRYVVTPSVKYRTEKYALQEGLISNLWQIWSNFCRDIILASTQGARTETGTITTSPYSTLSAMEIAFIAKKLALKQKISRISPLQGSYLEPTWGDSNKINLIISGLRCSNQGNLLTAFGVAARIEDLQMCRNACAHITSDMVKTVSKAIVRYKSNKIYHPSEIMLWTDPVTGDYLWKSWVDEIEFISDAAIK